MRTDTEGKENHNHRQKIKQESLRFINVFSCMVLIARIEMEKTGTFSTQRPDRTSNPTQGRPGQTKRSGRAARTGLMYISLSVRPVSHLISLSLSLSLSLVTNLFLPPLPFPSSPFPVPVAHTLPSPKQDVTFP